MQTIKNIVLIMVMYIVSGQIFRWLLFSLIYGVANALVCFETVLDKKKVISVMKKNNFLCSWYYRFRWHIYIIRYKLFLIEDQISKKSIGLCTITSLVIIMCVMQKLTPVYYIMIEKWLHHSISTEVFGKIKHSILVLLGVPAILATIELIYNRFTMREIYHDYYYKVVNLQNNLRNNVRQLLSKYTIDGYVEEMIRHITCNIGFRWERSKIIIENKKERLRNAFVERNKSDFSLNPIHPLLKEIRSLTEMSGIKDVQMNMKIFGFDLQTEKYLISINEDKDIAEIHKYFHLAKSQVYKKYFTNTRIVQEKKLDHLEFNLIRLERIFQNYYDNLAKYETLCRIMLCESEKCRTTTYGLYISRNLSVIIRYWFFKVLNSYFKIVLKLLY